MPFAPLAGVRVVDVTTSYAGPTCTQLLGALGADVIKVEPPAGDEARLWGPPFAGGLGTLFVAANSGKRSVALDLRRGTDVVLRLVDGADVFIQSLRPGLADELGLGAEALRAAEAGARPLHDLLVRPRGPEGEAARLRPAAPGRRRPDLGDRRARPRRRPDRRLADRPHDRDVRGVRDPGGRARRRRRDAGRLALGDRAVVRLLPPDRHARDRDGSDRPGDGLPRRSPRTRCFPPTTAA